MVLYMLWLILRRRVLKNREKEVIIEPPEMGHPLNVSTQKKKESIHSIKNAIGTYLKDVLKMCFLSQHIFLVCFLFHQILKIYSWKFWFAQDHKWAFLKAFYRVMGLD